MSSGPGQLRLVEFSTGLYQLLLHAYPTRFQRQFGPEMAGVFRDCCLRALNQSGGIGMFELWVITLFDLARSAIEEHARKETGMPNSNFVRLSGWAFIVGAVLLLPNVLTSLLWGTRYEFNLDASVVQAMGFTAWLAPLLLAVGLLGLRSRYGRQAGTLGSWILLGGAAAGSAMVTAGILGMMFAPSPAIADNFWLAWVLGILVLLSSLFIFGTLAVIRKPLPRWNALPLIAGAWPLLLLAFGVIAGLRTLTSDAALAILVAGLVIMTFALILLGYVLQSDAHREQPAFA